MTTESTPSGEGTQPEPRPRGRRMPWRRRRSYLKNVDEEVESLLELIHSDRDEKYLDVRWKPQVLHARDGVADNKRNYYLTRVPAVLGALILPALTNPSIESALFRRAAFALSVLVAVATGVESVFRYGSRWRLYRKFLDEMRAEGWAYYFALAAPYGGRDEAKRAHTFISRSEGIIARHGESYVAEIVLLGAREEAPEPAATRNPDK